jgi:hypothetical protein
MSNVKDRALDIILDTPIRASLHHYLVFGTTPSRAGSLRHGQLPTAPAGEQSETLGVYMKAQ